MKHLMTNDLSKVHGGQTSCKGSSESGTVTCQTTVHQDKSKEIFVQGSANTNTGQPSGGGVGIKFKFD